MYTISHIRKGKHYLSRKGEMTYWDRGKYCNIGWLEKPNTEITRMIQIMCNPKFEISYCTETVY